VSDGGVKVIAEYLEIPEEFIIILSTGRPAPMSVWHGGSVANSALNSSIRPSRPFDFEPGLESASPELKQDDFEASALNRKLRV